MQMRRDQVFESVRKEGIHYPIFHQGEGRTATDLGKLVIWVFRAFIFLVNQGVR